MVEELNRYKYRYTGIIEKGFFLGSVRFNFATFVETDMVGNVSD
jgi:hypothetical protein